MEGELNQEFGGESPSNPPRGVRLGMPVAAYNGRLLGHVREIHPHYLLVSQEGDDGDLEVPAHAVTGIVDGRLRTSVNREAVTAVDDTETPHRLGEEVR